MLRSLSKERQKVWCVDRKEKLDGTDTIVEYGTPIMKRMTVSATSGTPEELSAGVVPEYDRYITSYERSFLPEEGTGVFVDIEPELDATNKLKMQSDGITPVTFPDYKIEKILDTKKGHVARYGIKRINNGE